MNIRRGDTHAWVTGCRIPALNGRVVRVLRRVVPGEVLVLPDGEHIRLSASRTADWMVEFAEPVPIHPICGVHWARVRPIRDACLRPFRGLPLQEETTHADVQA